LGYKALPDKIIAVLAQQTLEEFLTTVYGPAVVTSLTELKGRNYDRACMQKYDKQRQLFDSAQKILNEPAIGNSPG